MPKPARDRADRVSHVAISIVTFNSARVIGACIRALPPHVPLYVMDNGSRDDTVNVIRALRPDAVVKTARRNLGFGRAHNRTMRAIRRDHPDVDFILVLNPDTILQPGCFDQVLHTAQTYPAAGIIGALHIQDDGTINPCFRNDFDFYPQLARPGTPFHARGAAARITPQDVVCVEQITGALMLLRTAALDRITGFDKRLFMYFEDDDLCARARLAGYNILLCPQARVVHLEGKSSGTSYRTQWIKGYHFERSRKYMHRFYHGRGWSYYIIVMQGVGRCLRRAVKAALKGRMTQAVYYLAGCAALLSA